MQTVHRDPELLALETAPPLPVRVYTPEPALGHPAVLVGDLARDLHAGRELAWRLFLRDLKAQYRQTYFGYLWAFLPPLVASVTFIFLQSQGVVQAEGTGIPYAAFAMIGTLLWQTFVESINSPLAALLSAKTMLAKINFPREAILLAGLYMVGFNFLIRMLLLVVVMVAWQLAPGPTLVFFPIAMAGLVLCGFAFGLLLVPLGGLYADVSRAIPMLTQFWMLLTPVVYPARTAGLAAALTYWNPVSPLIVTARAALVGQPLEHAAGAVLVTGLSLLLALVGLLAFRLVMPHLIARMGG
jgi:lipopolysaccharide transport system permease protein